MKALGVSLMLLLISPGLYFGWREATSPHTPHPAFARTSRSAAPLRAEAVVAQSPEAIQFMVAPEFPVGINPLSIAIGDFNGDGKRDLAVNNSNANTLSILLGNGDGTFQAKTDYPTGSFPSDVVVADFNSDQKADVAVLNKGDNTVSIFLGNGDGTFASRVNYVTGPAPVALLAEDLNHDGKPDLVISNSNRYPVAGPPSLSVLLNKGDGSFLPKVDYANIGGS